MDSVGTRQITGGTGSAGIASPEPKASLGKGMTSSPCRACAHLKAGIERKICREYDDCLLNNPQPKTEPIEEMECKECGDKIPHTKEYFASNRWGLMSICKLCMRDKRAAGKAVSKLNKNVAKPPHQQPNQKNEAPIMTNQKRKCRKKINERRIGFGSENADLMADLERYAMEDFRTFKQEVIFILSKYRIEREPDGQRKG